MKLLHAFPIEVDHFLGTNYCFVDTYENPRTTQQDLLYSIPAEVTIQGKTYRGFLQYAVDSVTKTCYHRCFSDRTQNFTNQLITHTIWRPIDYPTLEQAREISKAKIQKLKMEETPFEFNPSLRTAKFQTPEATYVLFRIGE